MVLRLALGLPLLGLLANGLTFVHDQDQNALQKQAEQDAETEVDTPPLEGTGAKTKKMGFVGATKQLLKAKADAEEARKSMEDHLTQFYDCSNQSAVEAKKAKHNYFRAEELFNDRDERERVYGKGLHVFMDEELAEARHNAGDPNMTGVYILTDKPESWFDKQVEASRSAYRRQHRDEFNATRFLEIAHTAAFEAERWEVRGAYHHDMYMKQQELLQDALDRQAEAKQFFARKDKAEKQSEDGNADNAGIALTEQSGQDGISEEATDGPPGEKEDSFTPPDFSQPQIFETSSSQELPQKA